MSIRENSIRISVLWIVTGAVSLWCGFAIALRAQNVSVAPTRADSQSNYDETRDANCGIIYLGIVGALETSNNRRSGVVLIRDTLRGPTYPDVCSRSFSPYTWTAGLHWLLKHFRTHSGRLTTEEPERTPKVILVGHSTGGWAVLGVARNLRRKNIPVELIVMVDSVGITDHTVPKNVKAAAIFHARDILMPVTTKKLRLEDPSHTKIIANVLVKGAGHESVTRDPRIRDLIMSTVESLRSASASAGDGYVETQP